MDGQIELWSSYDTKTEYELLRMINIVIVYKEFLWTKPSEKSKLHDWYAEFRYNIYIKAD